MSPPIHPNTLTALRLPLAPIAVAALVWGQGAWGEPGAGVTGILIAAILSLILELTDLADGWLARRYDVVSDFGKLFDPYADALSRFTLFLGLYAVNAAALWMLILIFYRDSTVAFLRSIAATRQIVLPARTSGKVKAIVQGVGTQVCYIALVVAALAPDAPVIPELPWYTMFVITIVTTYTLFDYLWGNRSLLQAAWYDR